MVLAFLPRWGRKRSRGIHQLGVVLLVVQTLGPKWKKVSIRKRISFPVELLYAYSRQQTNKLMINDSQNPEYNAQAIESCSAGMSSVLTENLVKELPHV